MTADQSREVNLGYHDVRQRCCLPMASSFTANLQPDVRAVCLSVQYVLSSRWVFNNFSLTRYTPYRTGRLLLQEPRGEGRYDGEKIDKKQSSTYETRPTPQFGTLDATSLSEDPSRRRCIVSELASIGSRPPSSEFEGWQRDPMTTCQRPVPSTTR